MAGKVQLPCGQTHHHVRAVHMGGELYLPVMLEAPHQRRVSHNSRGAGAKNNTPNTLILFKLYIVSLLSVHIMLLTNSWNNVNDKWQFVINMLPVMRVECHIVAMNFYAGLEDFLDVFVPWPFQCWWVTWIEKIHGLKLDDEYLLSPWLIWPLSSISVHLTVAMTSHSIKLNSHSSLI